MFINKTGQDSGLDRVLNLGKNHPFLLKYVNMEYNRHKSVTIPNQTIPLRELLHRFTNGVPISDNLQRQGSYDFSKPFTSSSMPTNDMFDYGHDVNEIDITIAQAKVRNSRSIGSSRRKSDDSVQSTQNSSASSGQQDAQATKGEAEE